MLIRAIRDTREACMTRETRETLTDRNAHGKHHVNFAATREACTTDRQFAILRELVNFTTKTRTYPHLCCEATVAEWQQLVQMMNVAE
jgi:hypothetical protein